MAKLKTISVTYDRKFNLGNFESAHLATTLWADLEPEDAEFDPKEIIADLYEVAKETLKHQYVQIMEAIRRKEAALAAAAKEDELEEATTS